MADWGASSGDAWGGGSNAGAGFKPDGGFTQDTSAGFTNSGDSGFGGGEGFGGGGEGANGGDDACRICGQTGHFARECPDKKPSGCFNCGQTGHIKNECTNERVERPFDGECRVCNERGHRASDCPSKPPMTCHLCGGDHKASECSNKRTDMFKDAKVMTDEEAWDKMKTAGKDLDLFRAAFHSYCRFMYNKSSDNEDIAGVKAHELEKSFRRHEFGVYLIAKEKEADPRYTFVSPAGEIDQKYLLVFSKSAKPPRPIQAKGWPKDPEENMKRLESAGFELDCGHLVCSTCSERGHVSSKCPSKGESSHEGPVIKCVICDTVGHRARDCKNRPADTCRRCNGEGHKAVDCTAPRDASDVECGHCGEMGHFKRDCPSKPQVSCHNCYQTGHMSKDCPNERVIKCRNCDAEGHLSKECPKPTDWSRVRCKNCGELGHTIRKCPVADTAPAGEGVSGDGGFGPTETSTEPPAAGGWGNDDAGGVSVAANGNW